MYVVMISNKYAERRFITIEASDREGAMKKAKEQLSEGEKIIKCISV